MKDRIARAPGRYSAIVPTEELEKLESGNAFEITLVRDDDPEEIGTPYNKASVLPDDLAERLCPDIEDPTPADALQALYNGATPPMVEGVEYRTTERYNGKAVYAKFVNCGTFEIGENTIPIATDAVDAVDAKISIVDGVSTYFRRRDLDLSINVSDGLCSCVFRCDSLAGVSTASVLVKYTKTTN